MSISFQCPHCLRNFSTRNAYSQHVNQCINTVYLSTKESSEDISDIVSSVNEMSLDDEDFSHINEFQIIREENSQHVNRCINTVYLSTKESSEDISDIVSSVNEMSLDDEDFSHINEFQIIREENSQVFYQYENDQDYAGDISFGEISHSSNIPEEYENFDEILPASLQSNEEPVLHSSNISEEYENFDEILPTSLQSNEEPEVENIKEFPNEGGV
ncbi:hypothetical protein Glove_95g76 [Diversispora epigaea]|uniref:Uncharacterized protein n=1 Tax=Diversispora epigaea TaxID=1348612 RepID=A0A397J4Y7_9GLOM|nr:hypothetical protein Glove_95g76 [Diversispora epigaea]